MRGLPVNAGFPAGCRATPSSTNGANHASPGQRSGLGPEKDKTLKGRHKMRPPFQGFDSLGSHDPGRCPGLACLRAFGPQRISTAKVHDTLQWLGQRPTSS